MTKNYLLILLLLLSSITYLSCSEDADDNYENITPVQVDLTQVPYPKLSDYNFFEGPIKDQKPSLDVLPYEPASSLFTDYALKKRFVWMPEGTLATYNGDGNVLELPVGAVIIKNFYYNNVQPSNTTRIIESRLMIRKSTGWIFAEYVWNEQQTEATLQMDGSFTPISWIDGNGINQNTNYRIPSDVECLICHKTVSNPIPIGTKPQSLNSDYPFSEGMKNQLSKWIEYGYLDANIPNQIETVVDYKDVSEPLDLRVRSYVDINCAHCHKEHGHCDYRPMRLAYSETADPINLGLCVEPQEFINGSLAYIIKPSDKSRSMMYYRLGSTLPSERMPLLGRTIVHEEGLQLLEDWINWKQTCN